MRRSVCEEGTGGQGANEFGEIKGDFIGIVVEMAGDARHVFGDSPCGQRSFAGERAAVALVSGIIGKSAVTAAANNGLDARLKGG